MYGDYFFVRNILSVADQNILSKLVASSDLPYRFYVSHNYFDGEPDPRFVDPMQLTHHLYMKEDGENKEIVSPHFEKFVPLIMSLKSYFGNIQLLRMKVNAGFMQPEEVRYTPQVPHVDLKYDNGEVVPHWVCVYYLDYNDAPTYLFKENLEIAEKIKPEKGTALFFDGSTLHAGSNPALEPLRFVVNIDFIPEKIPSKIFNISQSKN